MRWTIGRRLAAGFGLALAILIAIGVISYRNTTILLQTADWVAHTQQVLVKLENVISLLKDAEAGQRGYLITGEGRYLEPYHATIGQVEVLIREVRELTRDNPVQQRRLDDLAPLIGAKFAELQETIDLRKNLGFAAALQVVLTDKGKTIMDDLRGVITAMEGEEQRLLTERSREGEASARRTLVVIIAGTLLALTLMSVCSVAIARSITKPVAQIAMVANRIAQGDIHQTIPDRNTRDEITDLARAFNTMTAERKKAEEALRLAHDKLEVRVEERTSDLAAANSQLQKEITERKRAEDALRQAAKMEAVGRLAGGVAHDFNNLLTAVTGYSELLLERVDPKDPLRHFLEEIKKAGERAATLTKQLLAFSRRQVIQPKAVDLNTLVTTLVKMLQRLIGEDILLHTTLAPSLGLVYVDAGQFEQVIMNLAVNARDAMPEGGTLTIETTNVERAAPGPSEESPDPPAPAVRLTVRDSGQGMDAETCARIFEPFFTTKEVGQGTGLGLAMVYGIVTQSGGTIAVESTPGQGTTFAITLPRSEAPAEAVEAPAAPPALLTGTETILLVEDEAIVRGFAREVLRRAGYQVLETAHGQEALRCGQCYDGPIHLLLTDAVMPGMNGPELAEELTVIRPEIKVQLMTGYLDGIVTRQALQNAGNALLQKPFSQDVLLRAVREALTTEVVVPGRNAV